MPVDVHSVVGAHLALDGGNGAVVVGNSLPLGKASDHPLTGLGKSDHRRRGSAAFRVGDDDRLAAFHHGDAAVGRTKVDTNNLRHNQNPPKTC